MLETLRGVIDTLAGPQSTEGGLALALLALCRGLGADAIALHHADGGCSHLAAGRCSARTAAARAVAAQAAAAAVLQSAATGSTGPGRSGPTCWRCPSPRRTAGPW